MNRRLYHLISGVLYIVVIAAAWMWRRTLETWMVRYIAWWAAVVVFGSVFIGLLALIEWEYRRNLKHVWRERARERLQWPLPRSRWFQKLTQTVQWIEKQLVPLFETRLGNLLWTYWQDAGFPQKRVIMLGMMFASWTLGYLSGWFSTHRAILAWFFAFVFWLALIALIGYKAAKKRSLFREQLPDVVDRLADALQAGFSLPQAIEFVTRGLTEPSASEMERVSHLIKLGLSVDQALAELAKRQPDNNALAFLVEGLALQRHVGGNLVLLLREIANSLREQVQLENEIRTLTTQGRLSAIVIALLVPISLGILSFFPGYVDVLFNTFLGNLILVVVGLLELIGAILIWRIIKVDF
ncbi:MAG: hypothetical protein GXO35_06705 [Gammaproteobacteria bacterium]|nr:hypothetical protein [Gammaproteobacteria bacterium]